MLCSLSLLFLAYIGWFFIWRWSHISILVSGGDERVKNNPTELLVNIPCVSTSRVGILLTTHLLLSKRIGVGRFISFMGKAQDLPETVSKLFSLSCNGRQSDAKVNCYKHPSQDGLDNGTEWNSCETPFLALSEHDTGSGEDMRPSPKPQLLPLVFVIVETVFWMQHS